MVTAGEILARLSGGFSLGLRALLRAGATDDQVAAAWRGAVAAKLPGHGINDPGFLQPARPMSAIGG
jgi:cyclic pyranopterin phosphate synthase